MDESYIADRITELRLARNISEYQMSLELGQSKSYIQGISSKKNLPSVKQLFNIADYFDMTLSEFFEPDNQDSPAVRTAIQELRKLDDDDVKLLLAVIRRLALLSREGTVSKIIGRKVNSKDVYDQSH